MESAKQLMVKPSCRSTKQESEGEKKRLNETEKRGGNKIKWMNELRREDRCFEQRATDVNGSLP